MNFNSFSFIFLFLPAALVGFYALGTIQARTSLKPWLLAASLVFMAAGRLQDLPFLMASIALNCMVATQLTILPSGSRRRRTVFVAGLAGNLLFLGYFKYKAFLVALADQWMGLHISVSRPSFPLGISFYTVYQIMLLVDCYEDLAEDYNWRDHLVFASFFPYVTMGPIVRWKQIVPQLNGPDFGKAQWDNLARGLYIFVIGLFKKVVLADSFFRWSDAGFNFGGSLSLVGAWITALTFTCQLYFDFSGYTDMAIGVALMFNITLPANFNAPYRSQSLIEFWRRWHITLSNFITTYLYTPMIRGMQKVSFSRMMLVTFVAMLIAGFWHGANWTFVVFGSLHGLGLVANQIWKRRKRHMPGPIAWALTFIFVVITFVFFNSRDLSQAGQIVRSMFSIRTAMFSYEPWLGIDRIDQVTGVAWMLLGTLILYRAPSSQALQQKFRPSWMTVAATMALAALALIYTNGVVSRSFVYRDF